MQEKLFFREKVILQLVELFWDVLEGFVANWGILS